MGLSLLLASACGGAGSKSRDLMTPKQITANAKPSIVRIEVEGHDGSRGIGTGFFVASNGRIATNLHVIVQAKIARVVLLDGTEFPVSSVYAVDENRDLAIIGISTEKQTPALQLGDSDRVAEGEKVIAIGNPQGFDYTVSDGLVSGVRRAAGLTMLQISAPISQGSSGGPLFNEYGEVIGVATLLAREGQNLNFAVPANYLRPMLQQNAEAASFEAFSEVTARVDERSDAPRVVRKIPRHPVSLLDNCDDPALTVAVGEILSAIRKGAPIYNSGDHEACFRIYEGTALRLEREVGECRGVRDALGQGLLRAETLETFTEKAWAMRDAFDGVLSVVERKLEAEDRTLPVPE